MPTVFNHLLVAVHHQPGHIQPGATPCARNSARTFATSIGTRGWFSAPQHHSQDEQLSSGPDPLPMS